MSPSRIVLLWQTRFLRDALCELLRDAGTKLWAEYNSPLSARLILLQKPTHVLFEAGVLWQEELLPQLIQHPNLIVLRLHNDDNQIDVYQHQANVLTELDDFLSCLQSPISHRNHRE